MICKVFSSDKPEFCRQGLDEHGHEVAGNNHPDQHVEKIIVLLNKLQLHWLVFALIGSHARSNLGDMLLGSVSDQVIRKSKRPVLVIKRETED